MGSFNQISNHHLSVQCSYMLFSSFFQTKSSLVRKSYTQKIDASSSYQRLTFRFRDFLTIFGGSWFQRIWCRKKVSVSVLENLVSKKSLGFGKLGLEKKSRFRKIGSRKKVSVSVSENLVSEKVSFSD